MGRMKLAAATAVLVITSWCSSSALYFPHNSNETQSSEVGQRVIVKLRNPDLAKSSGNSTQKLAAMAELKTLAAQYAATNVEPMFAGQSNLRHAKELAGIQLVEFGNVGAALSFIEACATATTIEYAEPDYVLELFELPNDQLFAYQWNLRNIGQSYIAVHRLEGYNNDFQDMDSGIAGADIKATEIPSSSAVDSVVVAIIDSGIDPLHPDMQGVLWQNGDEIPANGVDDDHNGYVDDTWGWDFSANPNSVPIYSDNDPSDTYGHGSHCAGIIAATTNNQVGIAGVSAHARLMGLKIWPTMSVSLAARAVIYAADNGADVISMSWGTAYESLLLHDALQYARGKGVVLCAATGNSGTEAAFFPAAYEFVIAVGASSSRDGVTAFSTFGNHVDVCAPGESILSIRAGTTDMYGPAPSFEPFVHIVSDFYYEASGTSMACPHVAGAAAELRAHSPGLKPERVETILLGSCDDFVDPRGDGSDLPGRDKYSGFGRLNIKRALERTPEITAEIDSPTEGAIVSGLVDVWGSAIAQPGGSYAIAYRQLGSDNWSVIDDAAAQVNHSMLTGWDTRQLEGAYELRLTVGEDNMVVRTVLIVSRARAEFISPVQSEVVSGATEMEVVAVCPGFASATLDYRPAAGNTAWVSIVELTEPAVGNEKVFWDSSRLADGEYVIRLRVFDRDGLADSAMITISLSSPFAGNRGWRTPIVFSPSIVPNYGDFDGDGHNEIVIGTEFGILFFNTDGTPKTTGVPTLPFGNYLVPPVVCSLDGDSTDDLVFMREGYNAIYAFASNGELFDTSVYNEPRTWRYTTIKESHFPLMFAVDLNNDNRDEIVYKSGRGSNADVDLLIFSPGREEESCFPLDLDCSTVQTADLDGDRIFEIYTGSSDGRIRQFNLCGDVVNEMALGSDDWQFMPTGMTAVDVMGDRFQELVVMGYITLNSIDIGYILFSVNDDMRIVDGSALVLGIPSILDPSMAVFGDIDGDKEPETIVSFHDANYGYVFAWHRDGTPVIEDQPMRGLLAVTAHAGICAMPVLVDVDQEAGAEVVCPTGRDLFGTFPRQRVEVFNSAGSSLPGWPLYVAPHGQENLSKANIPVYGDIDRDGDMDMMIVTPANELVFTSFEGIPWNDENAVCPQWRYNRKLNNIAPNGSVIATAVEDESDQLPRTFMAAQNFPNPFNSSTVIEYNLPSTGEVEIDIYNVLGQTIESFSLPAQSAGRHSVRWEANSENGTALPSGVYLYSIKSNSTELNGKMMLLK